MPSAAFHFESGASLAKYSATAGEVIDLVLDSVDGVRTVTWTVVATDETSAGEWTITNPTAITGATLTAPASGSDKACIVECVVNGGSEPDPRTGRQVEGDLRKRAKAYRGDEVVCVGEVNESNATYGWAPLVNDAIRGGGGGGSGTVTPDPDELVLRDGTGQAWATAFVGKSTEAWKAKSDIANYAFAESTGASFPVTLVCDGTQSYITCSSTSGFRYRAAEHTFSQTSASGVTGSLTVELRSGEMRIEGKGASKPVELHAPSGQELRLASLGGSRMRLGGSGLVALDRWTGSAWELSGYAEATASKLAISSGDLEPDGANVSVDNSGVARAFGSVSVQTAVGSSPLTLTESDSSGTYLLAANAPMRVQPEQATSGAGRALTIGGGAGQTPGTHKAGDVTIPLGQRVSNETAKLSLTDSSGEFFFIRGAADANRVQIQHTRANSAVSFESGSTNSAIAFVANTFVQFWAQASNSYFDVLSSYYQWRDVSGTTRKTERLGSATIASATTTDVATFATGSNRVYQCVGYLTVSNDTDNEGACYMVRAAFKNVGGTVTQIGSTQAIAADLEDAGQTGLAAVLDFSGTNIRLRLTTDAADTVNVNGWLDVHERVLA